MKKYRVSRSVEAVLIQQSVKNVWDDFQADKPQTIMTTSFPNDSDYAVRFIGPFIEYHRFFVPRSLKERKHEFDLGKIANGDKDEIRRYKTTIPRKNSSAEQIIVPDISRRHWGHRVSPINREADRFGDEELNVLNNNSWPHLQKCILVNAISENEQIKILTLTKLMVSALVGALGNRDYNEAIISGINAHSIVFNKRGNGLNQTVEAKINPMSKLSDQFIEKICSDGLYDIPTVVEDYNKSNCAFYYKKSSNYKMNNEMLKDIRAEVRKHEEGKHLNATETQLNEIPLSSFENYQEVINPINHLEV